MKNTEMEIDCHADFSKEIEKQIGEEVVKEVENQIEKVGDIGGEVLKEVENETSSMERMIPKVPPVVVEKKHNGRMDMFCVKVI